VTDTAPELDRLAATAHLLVALDFDGTVSPLVDEPMSARMLPPARAALDALAALPDTTVALVSGRTVADLKVISEYDPSSALLLAGSHGAELWDPESDSPSGADDQTGDATLRDELIAAAEEAVDGLEGAWIERKAFGLGLHTRTASADDAAVAVERVGALVAERAPQWRRRDGRDILEFAFRHEGKDSAVAALRSRVGASAVLFAGDDVTDEDAIASLGPDDLGVRVGGGATAARVRVADAAAFAELLADLAERRAAHLSA
jgi:trehalose 6-phosphate phosphatase